MPRQLQLNEAGIHAMAKIPNAYCLREARISKVHTYSSKIATHLILPTTDNLRAIRRHAKYSPCMPLFQIRDEGPGIAIPYLDAEVVTAADDEVRGEEDTTDEAIV